MPPMPRHDARGWVCRGMAQGWACVPLPLGPLPCRRCWLLSSRWTRGQGPSSQRQRWRLRPAPTGMATGSPPRMHRCLAAPNDRCAVYGPGSCLGVPGYGIVFLFCPVCLWEGVGVVWAPGCQLVGGLQMGVAKPAAVASILAAGRGPLPCRHALWYLISLALLTKQACILTLISRD